MGSPFLGSNGPGGHAAEKTKFHVHICAFKLNLIKNDTPPLKMGDWSFIPWMRRQCSKLHCSPDCTHPHAHTHGQCSFDFMILTYDLYISSWRVNFRQNNSTVSPILNIRLLSSVYERRISCLSCMTVRLVILTADLLTTTYSSESLLSSEICTTKLIYSDIPFLNYKPERDVRTDGWTSVMQYVNWTARVKMQCFVVSHRVRQSQEFI